MNLFESLILGHLVADWLLQSDWMALGKRRRLFTLPGLIHCSIYTIITLSILWFMTHTRNDLAATLVVGAVIFLSHWLVDGTDLVQRWMRWFGQRDQAMVRIMIDQTLHLLVLGGVSVWGMGGVAGV